MRLKRIRKIVCVKNSDGKLSDCNLNSSSLKSIPRIDCLNSYIHNFDENDCCSFIPKTPFKDGKKLRFRDQRKFTKITSKDSRSSITTSASKRSFIESQLGPLPELRGQRKKFVFKEYDKIMKPLQMNQKLSQSIANVISKIFSKYPQTSKTSLNTQMLKLNKNFKGNQKDKSKRRFSENVYEYKTSPKILTPINIATPSSNSSGINSIFKFKNMLLDEPENSIFYQNNDRSRDSNARRVIKDKIKNMIKNVSNLKFRSGVSLKIIAKRKQSL